LEPDGKKMIETDTLMDLRPPYKRTNHAMAQKACKFTL